MGALEGLRHRAVRQGKIEQDEIDAAVAEPREAVGQRGDVLQFKRSAGGVSEVFAHEARVAQVILDEEHLSFRVGLGRIHFGLGKVWDVPAKIQQGTWRRGLPLSDSVRRTTLQHEPYWPAAARVTAWRIFEMARPSCR